MTQSSQSSYWSDMLCSWCFLDDVHSYQWGKAHKVQVLSLERNSQRCSALSD